MILHTLKHFLPSQAPLKDFIHHNTLHAFQDLPFDEALHRAALIFGYKVYGNPEEYRALYRNGKIYPEILDKVILEEKPIQDFAKWKQKMLEERVVQVSSPRLGKLRQMWKDQYRINLDKVTHPILFRLISGYLDQGISIWNFPVSGGNFIEAVRALNQHSLFPILKSPRTRQFLNEPEKDYRTLMKILVGNEKLYLQYLMDQQFSHPGWSGMVSWMEDHPESMPPGRRVSLEEFIWIELLLEIDYLDQKFNSEWKPIGVDFPETPEDFLGPVSKDPYFEVLSLWQKAYEWSFYDQVLSGLQQIPSEVPTTPEADNIQAVFCIDDRSCSIRRYVEQVIPGSRTYGTAGFFNIPFYYLPHGARYNTKLCPAPIRPSHIIREISTTPKHRKDLHFSKHSQGLFGGWFISQSMGFWAALRLMGNIFYPTESPAMVSSFKQMDPEGSLKIHQEQTQEEGYQEGFTVQEMAELCSALLKSIGMTEAFSPLVYLVGHGASSVNNTYYAGYDCGACSGRAGSVNARVAAYMLNQSEVRRLLREKGIDIPEATHFIPCLHDTTRDEMLWYDVKELKERHKIQHAKYQKRFQRALQLNAKERARRFELLRLDENTDVLHQKVKLRSVSLFEPRPELNHANNALCIVGRRSLSQRIFLDRRAFLNSYDPFQDQDGSGLGNILNAIIPVCGGINLEYYFSKQDPERLGAGSKLSHNVMGLIGVANGMEGDLRPGLPVQMTEMHDPLRLMVIIEQAPEIILRVLQIHSKTEAWFGKEWIHLISVHPQTRKLYRYTHQGFVPYTPVVSPPEMIDNLITKIESTRESLPVYRIKSVS